ncbi:G2 and S phase-expressed protein 1 isoform 2-T2 [Pholidichthys leucotaenia]
MGTQTEGEDFVQEAEAKLSMLSQTASIISPIKRQTFCVQDSPMKQLPPAIQRQLQRGSSSTHPASTAASSTRPASTRTSSARPVSVSRCSTTFSPLARAKVQPKSALRGKASLGVSVVLPSKPAIPATSTSTNKSKVDKTKLQPRSKVVGSWKKSPSSSLSNRVELWEDLVSDSASMASDISDSLNSSSLGKRTLAPPTKGVGVRNVPGGKDVLLQSRRKNTSSSSSSVSSFNSSTSVSPAKGKLNSSLNCSLSSSTCPTPSSVNKPTNASRQRRSTVNSAAEQVPTIAARRGLMTTQAKKLSEAERVKAARSTPQRREATPPKRPAPFNSGSSNVQSGWKPKVKPEAPILPTPTSGVKGADLKNSVSKMLKPKRLTSLSTLDSRPQKQSAGPLTPSSPLLLTKPQRPSALPTPVKRRVTAIPSPISTSQTETVKPTAMFDSDTTPEGKQLGCRPVPSNMQAELVEELTEAPKIQPFCLDEEEGVVEPPVIPPTDDQQPNQSQSTDPETLSLVESTPKRNLMELEPKEENGDKTDEVLLLDLPPPILPLQEKLLIDLTNTPDLIRTANKTCTTTQQLIDLSSPLIKWSPEKKEENVAPLINLSF